MEDFGLFVLFCPATKGYYNGYGRQASLENATICHTWIEAVDALRRIRDADHRLNLKDRPPLIIHKVTMIDEGEF